MAKVMKDNRTTAPADGGVATQVDDEVDPAWPVARLFRDLRSSAEGLSAREAERRLLADGPNQLTRRGGRRWPGELAGQFTHPLALLLAAAAVLAFVSGTAVLAAAIVAVIVLNAGFAFLQERHAEHAVEALAAFLPSHASVLRDGSRQQVEATSLVPGDVLVIEEGDRISADARLISGTVEVDLSTLTGESQPVTRSAGDSDPTVALLQAQDMVFSGSACLAGEARALVTATGMRTEIGRIAALSERVGRDTSPLEIQVKTVAKLIALVAIAAALAFLPLGLLAGLTVAAAISFAIGMLVANVPEGLLPTITLALAVGVQDLARRGAVVKRLSAVETLGSTTVICTDKTGTLTAEPDAGAAACGRRRGSVTSDDGDQPAWQGTRQDQAAPAGPGVGQAGRPAAARRSSDATGSTGRSDRESPSCSSPPRSVSRSIRPRGRPPADDVPVRPAPAHDDHRRRRPATGGVWVNTKGAPEAVLARCTRLATEPGQTRPLTDGDRSELARRTRRLCRREGCGFSPSPAAISTPGSPARRTATGAERELCLLGLVAPP